MTLSRRRLLGTAAAGLAGVAGVTAAGGCSSAGRTPADTLSIWNNLESAAQVDYFRSHFVDAYTKTHVDFSSKSSNTIDRLIQTSLAAGGGPSIIVTPGPSSFVAAYDSAGYLADLTSYAQRFGWDDKLAGWAVRASQIDRRLVTLPLSYESMAFYVNPATLDGLGLRAPTSLAEFENFCSEAQGRGTIPIAAGNADYKGANEWHVGAGLNHGAGPEAMYQALTGQVPWTEPVFVDAIAQLSGWFRRGWFGGSVDRYFTNSFPTVYRQLQSGEAAAMISGTWEFANLGDYFGADAGNDSAWAWSPLPSLRDGVATEIWDLAVGQSGGINTNTADLDAAAEYLNFLATDVRTIVDALEQVAFAPPPIRLRSGDFGKEADPRVVDLYTRLGQARTIGYTTWTFFPQQTETYMIDYFEKVITGDLSPLGYCQGIQERFVKERAQGRVPAAPKPDGGLS